MSKKFALFIQKIVLVTMVLALGLSAMPLNTVYAAGLAEDTTPPEREFTGERLEKSWQQVQRAYERAGSMLDRAETLTDKFQGLIDKANEHGLDTAALQAALNAFEGALKDAHPIYQSAHGIIAAHQGFDNDGKVTDPEKAVETVKSLGEKLKQIREIVGVPGKALREAFKAFREANPRPERENTPPLG